MRQNLFACINIGLNYYLIYGSFMNGAITERMYLLLLTHSLFFPFAFTDGTISSDPCDPSNHIKLNEWDRSVAYVEYSGNKCDNNLHPGWYRIVSGAGERMPTVCPKFGLKCNTINPIYLDEASVPSGESVYPDVGITVERKALVANSAGSCDVDTYNIKIKGCRDYFVHYLVPTNTCYRRYCFGDKSPCPEGLYSETGFGPPCSETADKIVTPFVKTGLQESSGQQNGRSFTFSKPVFKCFADDLDDYHKYQIRWYINEIEIEDAKKTNISKENVDFGTGQMLESHWKSTFKPNMHVKCSIQVGGNGFTIYGKPYESDNFFAGIKVIQSTDAQYILKEGEQLQIELQLTLPLACSWETKRTNAKAIRENECQLVIMNSVPKYQTTDKCKAGINDNNIVFESQQCGVSFTHANWEEPRLINVTGSPDGIVNKHSYMVTLRLYNSNSTQPTADLSYWADIVLPEIKLKIFDDDESTSGKVCKSTNDSHMTTTDGRTWELQSNHHSPGEYIMYKHDVLRQQVSVYYKECRKDTLCNCGVAVMSGNSYFVANNCDTTFNGQTKTNRYRIEKKCNDNDLTTEKISSSYTITLPTATQVLFNYADKSWIDQIRIQFSVLDLNSTSGLCGRYNGDTTDDFTPRGKMSVTTAKDFADSWQVKGKYESDSIFNTTKLTQTEYYGQQYCSCVNENEQFPHESPVYNCELTSAMELCRKSKYTVGVQNIPCVTNIISTRKRRSVLDQYKRTVEGDIDGDDDDDGDDQPPIYPMVQETFIASSSSPEWKNDWTETTARDYCERNLKESPANDVCTEYVPFVDPESYINDCILDIKYTGSTEYMEVTLRNYASSCLQESKRLENLTSTNGTNSTGFSKPIAEILAELTCLNNCSNNGICTEGECQCFPGHFGDLCSFSKSDAPEAIVNAVEDLCDSSKKPCKSILFPATGIVDNPDLTCKVTKVKIKSNGTHTETTKEETSVHQAKYFSDLYAKCPLHGARSKRSADFDVVATAYFVSLSNNGQNYSETVTTVVFDSVCYSCNSTTLTCEKQDSCPVTEADTEDEESSIRLVVGVTLGVVAGIVIIGIISFKLMQRANQRDNYIRDAFYDIPGRAISPKSHYVNDKDIFLSERLRTKSSSSLQKID